MANVCVITGGGSGMGLEAARNIPKDIILVITGRTLAKLEKAKQILESEGHEVHMTTCDVSLRKEVHELCLVAKELGTIKTVIHAAGLSPAMAEPEQIIRVNAIGTKNVNMEFYKYMDEGGVIVDVASSSAYQAPKFLIKTQIYEMAETDEDTFIKHLKRESAIGNDAYNKSGMAYVMSKNYMVWFAQKGAHTFAKKGIRVVSVSPGLIETDMGNLEAEHAQNMIEMTCAHRMGKPEEMGFAIATIADERNGYLSGIDVLIDGGWSTGKKFKKYK